MDKKKKAMIFTAFLLILLILALLSPLFVNSVDACFWRHKPPYKPRPPPLGKTIIKYFVYPDGTPIGECLEVELWDTGLVPIATGHTDSEGKVVFSGLVDQTYTIKYEWQGIAFSESLGRIDCSKIVWEFTNVVPYWTVCKTFEYDDGTPIVGLNVTFDGRWALTDASGTATFKNVKAGDYTISWSWQGIGDSESVSIDFSTSSPVTLENTLAYWTVEKTFLYDVCLNPVVGLNVTFDGRWALTNASGMVSFDKVKAGSYTLEWMWGGAKQNESISIGFDDPTPYVVPTNYLESKSGGDK